MSKSMSILKVPVRSATLTLHRVFCREFGVVSDFSQPRFSSQIRLAETRQPLVATNLIIYNITRLNYSINTIKYQLFLSIIHLLTRQ